MSLAMPDTRIDVDVFDTQVCACIQRDVGVTLTPAQLRVVCELPVYPLPAMPDLTAEQVHRIRLTHARALSAFSKALQVVNAPAVRSRSPLWVYAGWGLVLLVVLLCSAVVVVLFGAVALLCAWFVGFIGLQCNVIYVEWSKR